MIQILIEWKENNLYYFYPICFRANSFSSLPYAYYYRYPPPKKKPNEKSSLLETQHSLILAGSYVIGETLVLIS